MMISVFGQWMKSASSSYRHGISSMVMTKCLWNILALLWKEQTVNMLTNSHVLVKVLEAKALMADNYNSANLQLHADLNLAIQTALQYVVGCLFSNNSQVLTHAIYHFLVIMTISRFKVVSHAHIWPKYTFLSPENDGDKTYTLDVGRRTIIMMVW